MDVLDIDLTNSVLRIIGQNSRLGPEDSGELDYSTTLRELGCDSLDLMQIVVDLEMHYDTEIPEADIEGTFSAASTVTQVVAYCQTRFAKA